MIVLFELIVLTSIWNLGIEIILSDGMALEKVRRWAEAKESKWYEVSVWCVWCRPSLHSVFGYLAAIGFGFINVFEWKLLVMYPFVVAGTSLISGIIWSIYKLIEIKTLYYKHKEQNEFFNLKNNRVCNFMSNNITFNRTTSSKR